MKNCQIQEEQSEERNDIFCILSESAVTDSVIFVSNLCSIDHQNLSFQVGSPSNNSLKKPKKMFCRTFMHFLKK